MSAGNYYVCTCCRTITDRDECNRPKTDLCNTCPHHLARLREQAAIDVFSRMVVSEVFADASDDELARMSLASADELIAALKGGE